MIKDTEEIVIETTEGRSIRIGVDLKDKILIKSNEGGMGYYEYVYSGV